MTLAHSPHDRPPIPTVAIGREHRLSVTIFNRLSETKGQADEWELSDLDSLVRDPYPWPGSKEALPLIFWGKLPDDSRRAGASPIGLHALVLDYDDEPEASIEAIYRWWSDVTFVAHTTASHRPDKPRWRVIIPVSRPFTADEVGPIAHYLVGCGRGRMGVPELKSKVRAYFAPSDRGDGLYSLDANIAAGRALDIDAVMSLTPSVPAIAAPLIERVDGSRGEALLRGRVREAAAKLANARDGRYQLALAESRAIGGRMSWSPDLAGWARDELISAVRANPPSSGVEGAEKAILWGLESGAAAPSELPPDRPRPTWPLGPRQADQVGSSTWSTTDDGRPYLVKPVGGSTWYVATERDYVACDQGLVRIELNRSWPSLPTEKHFGEGQSRAMALPELYEEYGAQGRVFHTYYGSTRFRQTSDHGGELYLRAAIDDPPAAIDHGEIIDWMVRMFGGAGDAAFNWLATAPELDRPTAGLFLLGPPGVGKGMLASGISRYFGSGWSDYSDVFKGRFNGCLLRSPVIVCDEGAQVEARSTAFRQLLGNSVHAIEEKHHPTSTLLGCPRLVVCSNSPDPLKLAREDLNSLDEAAIGQRILMIDCDPAAADWLESRGGRAFTADWVSCGDRPGKIPETIEWLRQNRKVQRGRRFLVEGNASKWANRVSTSTGLPSTILDAVASWLRRGFRAGAAPAWSEPPGHAGYVLVSNGLLRQRWRDLVGPDERPPTHSAVANALCRLAPNGRQRVDLGAAGRPWVYAIPKEAFGDRLDD